MFQLPLFQQADDTHDRTEKSVIAHEILSDYLPPSCVQAIVGLLQHHHIQLKISRSRSSKLGDSRASGRGKAEIITVNHDLNPYAFLITTLHEISHSIARGKHGCRIRPHGREWKMEFRELLHRFATPENFPEDLLREVQNYSRKITATTGTDTNLARTLRKYDARHHGTLVADVPIDSLFTSMDGRMFRKMERLRKRYKCLCLNNQRFYLFSPMAVVHPIE